MEVEIKCEIDSKGRIVIPIKIREQLKIEAKDRVKIKIEEVEHRRSFTKECKGLLKGLGDAVELLHRESPFR